MEAAKTVQFVGKIVDLQGKRLFDILCRLKKFGVGRIVYRNIFNERYPQPSYFRITRVEPDMSDPTQASLTKERRSVAYGTQIFRGINYGEVRIGHGFKADWKLVLKQDEEEFLEKARQIPPHTKATAPTSVKFPPLLQHMMIQEAKAKDSNYNSIPLLNLVLNTSQQLIKNNDQ